MCRPGSDSVPVVAPAHLQCVRSIFQERSDGKATVSPRPGCPGRARGGEYVRQGQHAHHSRSPQRHPGPDDRHGFRRGGGASVFNTLVLDGGVVAGSGSGSASGNFAIGGYDVLSWGTFSGSLALFSTGTFTEAQSPTGSGVLSLDTGNGIFNPVGSSGALVGNILGGSVADQRLVGRWQIVEAPVAIPLPWHQRVSRSVVPRGGRDHHRRIVLSNTPRSHGP